MAAEAIYYGIIGLLAYGAGSEYTERQQQKMEKSAKPPPFPTNLPSLAGSQSQADNASAQQRKRAQAAEGRGSTIKTGPAGLGEIGSKNLAPKSLLGY